MIKVNYANYTTKHMGFGDRFRGVIAEAPDTILPQLGTGLLYYKAFHMIGDKKIKMMDKKFRKLLAGKYNKNTMKMMSFRHKYIVLLNRNRSRYPHTY
jgi:hypothetical protein